MNDTARDYKLRGAALMGSGQYKDAQTQFIKALENEESEDIYIDLGNAYASNGEYKEAIEAFSKALVMDPQNGQHPKNIYVRSGKVRDENQVTDNRYRGLKCKGNVTKSKARKVYTRGESVRVP